MPYLDALRGVAVLMVMLGHLSAQGFLQMPGRVGVRSFFVISGFVVTLLMLRERRRTGTLQVGQFRIRRLARLAPPLLVYLAALAVAQGLGVLHISPLAWGAIAVGAVGYVPLSAFCWETGHLWSLGVQEHFYLFWPELLQKLTPQRIAPLLAAWLVASPLIRYVVWRLNLPWLDYEYVSLTQMTGVVVGCLLAFMLCGEVGEQVRKLLIRRPALTAFLGVCGCVLSKLLGVSGKWNILFADMGISLSAALVIAGLAHLRVSERQSLLVRLLTWLGGMSYSLYLWQQPFSGKAVLATVFPHWTLNLLAILLCAWLSRELLEKPFLRWKQRLHTPRAPRELLREGDPVRG